MNLFGPRWLVVWFTFGIFISLAPAQTLILGTTNSQFLLNGKPTFLWGISYYGALAASPEFMRQDLTDMQRYGFNWIRVWANWSAFSNDVAAVDVIGHPREPFLPKLKDLVSECDRRGMIVDVTLSRGNDASGRARLQPHESHLRAVETLITQLKAFRNWYLDLSNERNVRDKRYTSFEELADLRERSRVLDPARLITASDGGDISREELRQYLQNVKVDFICPHRPRDAKSPAQTAAKTAEYLAWMRDIGRVVPVHYQEPFRRGYSSWEPLAKDFLTDARQAKEAGAAGWCFHNGDTRKTVDGQPRRSFDLRDKRLFAQLDPEELKFLQLLSDYIHSK